MKSNYFYSMNSKHILLPISLSFLFCFVIFFANGSIRDNELLVRSIGHEYLKQSKDDSTIILPVEKIENRYKMEFQNEFSYQPDLMIQTVYKVMEKVGFEGEINVEVEKCKVAGTWHNFKLSTNKEDNLAPCKGRILDKGCYALFFTFHETGNEVMSLPQKESGVHQLVFIVLLLFLGIGFYSWRRRRKHANVKDEIQFGKFVLNPASMTLSDGKMDIDLSSKECELLILFFENKNETVTREKLLKEIWDDEGDYVGRTLDVFISKLRKKLESESNVKILNIRGVGYRLVLE